MKLTKPRQNNNHNIEYIVAALSQLYVFKWSHLVDKQEYNHHRSWTHTYSKHL